MMKDATNRGSAESSKILPVTFPGDGKNPLKKSIPVKLIHPCKIMATSIRRVYTKSKDTNTPRKRIVQLKLPLKI